MNKKMTMRSIFNTFTVLFNTLPVSDILGANFYERNVNLKVVVVAPRESI